MPKLENASIHWVSLQSGAGRSSRHCRHTPACYAPSPPPTGDPLLHNFMHFARTVHSWWSKSHPIESAASIAFLSTSYYSYICFWPSPLYNCSQFSVCLYASILRSFDFWALPMNNRPKYTRDRQCLCICMPIDYSNSGEMVQHKKREIRKLRCIHEKYWLD